MVHNRKKRQLRFLTLGLLIALIFSLVSCDGLTRDGGEKSTETTAETTTEMGTIKDVPPHTVIEKEIVESEASCSSPGLKHIVCEICGELIRTIEIEKKPHDFTDVVTAPTCTEKGYTTHTCKVCSEVLVDTYVDEAGHTFEDAYSYNATQHWKNVTCGHEDVVVKQDHSLGEDGVCSVCGFSIFLFEKIEDKEEYRVIGYTSETEKTAVIPSEYQGLPVTELYSMALYQNTMFGFPLSYPNTVIESVVIPDSVTTIGDFAFDGCANLQSIVFPSSVIMIGASAFNGCANLQSIVFPSSVIMIGAGAFNGCDKCIEKENGVSYVDHWIVACDNSVTTVTIREGTVGIADRGFYGCSGLTSITIPSSVTCIGNEAFSGCSGLTGVYINDLAKWCAISFGSFEVNPLFYAYNLYLNGELVTDLTIPDGVTSIGNYAFCNCEKLTSVTIPEGVTCIGNYAFYGCSGLTSITIPSSVTSIGADAFYNCSGLTSITIPSSVTSIGADAFTNCNSLTYNEYDNAKYLGNKDKPFLVLVGVKSPFNITSVSIHIDTKIIYGYAFGECKKLVSVTIPSSVTSIGDYAFNRCSGLTSVTIPSSVTSIGAYAFYGSGLTSVTIPSSVTSIGAYAFSNCGLMTGVTISSGVTSIGNYAFSGCSRLKTITIPSSVTSIGFGAFSDCRWCFENESGASYVGNWIVASNNIIVTIRDGTVGIADGAFEDCVVMRSVTIPSSVTSIGVNAFYGCSGLTSITFQGTQAQWNAITKGSDWNYSTGDYTVHCTDGDIAKS